MIDFAKGCCIPKSYLLPPKRKIALETMLKLDNRLWVMAVQTAAEAGMEFTVPCSHNMRDFIRAGVSTMRREGKMEEADGETAGAALDSLVQEMIKATRALGITGKKIPIREGALVKAKKLCPLWPFG